MIKSIFAASAVALLTVPAVAQADETREFSHEGVNYAYNTEQKGKVTVINGETSSGERFRLYVKGDRVNGTYNNRSVTFNKSDISKLKGA